MRRIGLTLLMIGWTVVVASQALAQESDADRARARTEFDHGVQLYQAGSYQSALEAFQEAFRLAPHPTVRLNMANCYDHLNKPVEAIFHFEHYLTEAGHGAPAAQRHEVESNLERLREHVGQLNLRVAPDGARIVIDGTEERRAPVLEPVTLTAGTHRVETSLQGYATDRRTVEVPGGGHADLSLRLDRPGGGQVANNGGGGNPGGGNNGGGSNGGGNNGGGSNGGGNNGGGSNGGGGNPGGGNNGGGGAIATNTGGGGGGGTGGGGTGGGGGGGEVGGGLSGGGGGGGEVGGGGGQIGGGGEIVDHPAPGSDDVFQIGSLHVTLPTFLVAVAASVAGTAAIIMALVSVSANSAVATDKDTIAYCTSNPGACASSNIPDAMADQMHQYATAVSAANWADGLGVTALVGIAGTVVLLLLTQPSGSSSGGSATLTATPTFSRNGGGLSLHGTF